MQPRCSSRPFCFSDAAPRPRAPGRDRRPGSRLTAAATAAARGQDTGALKPGSEAGVSPDGGVSPDDGGGSKDTGTTPADAKVAPDQGGSSAIDILKGYWVWEKRVQGTVVQSGTVDKGQQKLAFGTGNNKCHYIWNEITGSDFHTECTYTVAGDLVTLTAPTNPGSTKAKGWSCAHPTWFSWSDRPAVQYSRYKFVGTRLWMGVNTYWGFGGGVNNVPVNNSLKRFPFWESKSQAQKEASWIVYKPVTRAEWYGKYAISTNCQGTAAECANLPGCGYGDKKYVD